MKAIVTNLTTREIDANIALFIDKLIKLREEKKQWDCLKEIVEFFKRQYPTEYSESVAISKDLQKSRGDEWGRGDRWLHRESRSANLRMVMNLPYRLIAIIRKVYSEHELPFDRKFLRKLGMIYPEFLVPEKGAKSFS